MAAPLEDLRAKITGRTSAVLDAHAQARGSDKSEVVREVLDAWAAEQIELAQRIFGAISGLVPLPVERTQPVVRIPIDAELRVAVYERDGGVCAYCTIPLDFDGTWHVDHRTPVALGGTNDLGNLTLSCASCNLNKGARTVEQWRQASHG